MAPTLGGRTAEQIRHIYRHRTGQGAGRQVQLHGHQMRHYRLTHRRGRHLHLHGGRLVIVDGHGVILGTQQDGGRAGDTAYLQIDGLGTFDQEVIQDVDGHR